MWPGVRVIEQNPFPFFPFNPRWRQQFTSAEFDIFCSLLRLAWISPRPCYLPPGLDDLARVMELRTPIPARVLEQFQVDDRTQLLFFPPQLRALHRLVAGEDLYSLLWDETL
jgi:hypothetical protein